MKNDSPNRLINNFTPALGKNWLYFLSGVTWSSVGIYLCSLTINWFSPITPFQIGLHVLGGVSLAFIIFRFGFSNFAYRNIQRVDSIPKKKVCIFAFQAWTSYPLVIFMVTLGIVLRKFSPIPKPWLGTLYIGIGGSLFLASLIYYWRVVIDG